MHTGPMSETQGEFTRATETDVRCRRCDERGKVVCQTWESSCGEYEDYKYTCKGCGYVWWVDGIDS